MADPLEQFRRPEYTGENRCWACTLANSVVLAVAVGAVAAAGRKRAAVAIAAAGTAAIGLRGYLVPYTPRFAPRLVAALPVDPFERGAPDTGSGSTADAVTDAETDADAPTGEAVVTALLEAGVVVPSGDELSLEPSFRTDWRRELRELRERDAEALAAVATRLTGPAVEARPNRTQRGTSLVLDGPGSGIVSLNEGVAVAELAAARALESRIDESAVRLAAGRPLRSLLEACPLCDGDLTVSRSTCCGEVTPVGSTPAEKLLCPDCDVRLFTYE